MSKAKHTPGPWSVSERLGFGWLIHPNVAVAYGGEGSGKQDEGEHNAHLIAAAPELLEALKNNLQFAEACHRMTDDKLMREAIGSDIIKARKAIAKAEGKQ